MRKHSITINGHRTSISLEAPFWDMLREIAATRGQSLASLVQQVDRNRDAGLSSALRLFVLAEIKQQRDAAWMDITSLAEKS
ncbi:MAG: ribbon-helix-helix domain-containing protein [Candidatus Puniceispirillum sp.]|jgi:predicted DNA-binding ribbon-helix-helix protein